MIFYLYYYQAWYTTWLYTFLVATAYSVFSRVASPVLDYVNSSYLISAQLSTTAFIAVAQSAVFCFGCGCFLIYICGYILYLRSAGFINLGFLDYAYILHELATEYNFSWDTILLMVDCGLLCFGGFLWADGLIVIWVDMLCGCALFGIGIFLCLYCYSTGLLIPVWLSKLQSGEARLGSLRQFFILGFTIFFVLCRVIFLFIRCCGYEIYDDLFFFERAALINVTPSLNSGWLILVYINYYLCCFSFLFDCDLLFKLCLLLNIFFIIFYYLHSYTYFLVGADA